MIQEAYVSFEVAKLLKEEGFDEYCQCAYSENGQYLLNCYKGVVGTTIKNSDDSHNYSCTAPTHQVALAWLRENSVIIVLDYNGDEDCEENERWGFSIYNSSQRKVDFATYSTYEEAVEAALKYALENLI